jgi:hypothetical protein
LAESCTATSATAVGSLVCAAGSVAYGTTCTDCTATNTDVDAHAKACTTADGSTVVVTDCVAEYAYWATGHSCVACGTGAATCTATSASAVTIDTCKAGYAL